MSPTNIFVPASTPADAIAGLSMLVLGMTGAIFVVVCGLLVYTLVRFRRTPDDGPEPAQVYESNQVEIAWTVVPMLIVVVLFLATARVITRVQSAGRPDGAIQVIAIGHQFWWEYRYPGLNVVTDGRDVGGDRTACPRRLRSGAAFGRVARRSRRVVFRDRSPVLVACRPAVAGRRAIAAGGNSPVPVCGDLALRCALSVSGLLRPRGVRPTSDRTRSFQYAGARRSASGRRVHVGVDHIPLCGARDRDDGARPFARAGAFRQTRTTGETSEWRGASGSS
jgi:hypothetical protein